MKWQKQVTTWMMRQSGWSINTLFICLTAAMLLPFYLGGVSWALATIFLLWRHRKSLRKIIKELGWIGGAWLFGVGVAIWNGNQSGLIASTCLGCAYLYFALYYRSVRPIVYMQLLNIIALGSIGTSLLAIVGYVNYLNMHQLPWTYIMQADNPGYRAMATLFNANYYSLFCIFAIVIGCYLMSKTRHRLWQGLYALSVGLNFIGIFLTASRMVLPALAVSVIGYYWFVNRRLVYGVVVLGLVASVGLYFHLELLARFSEGSLVHGLEEREWIWGGAWRLFADYPLTGRGPMSYATYFYLYEGKGQPHAHQLMLELLSSYGLYGTTLYFLGMVSYFRDRVALWRERSLAAENGLLVAMLLAVLVHGLMDVSIMWIQTGYILLAVMLCPVGLIPKVAELDAAEVFKQLWRRQPKA